MNAIAASERTGRVAAFSVVLWAAAVAGAALGGVLAKLADAELAALAAFCLVYALATYFVDAPLRAWVREAARPSLLFAAWTLVAALALLAWISAGGTHDAPLLAHWAAALVTLFAAPLAVVISAAALERSASLRLSAGKRPAARPVGI